MAHSNYTEGMMRFLKLACLLVAVFGFSCGGNDPTESDIDPVDNSSTDATTGTGTTGTGTTGTGATGSHDTSLKPTLYGQPYQGGQFHLGPVNYSETSFHNACASEKKYHSRVQQVEGNLLVGLWNGIPQVSNYCDACIYVTSNKGKSALLRVVTYGPTTRNSIDLSPEAYKILNSGEYPRSMTWQFAKCPNSGPIIYEFQTKSSEWWTSFWVRNARVPIAKVEVKSKNYPNWTTLNRASDGSLSRRGFGKGSFSIRTTGIDGQKVVDTFAWPSSGVGGVLLTGKTNFN